MLAEGPSNLGTLQETQTKTRNQGRAERYTRIKNLYLVNHPETKNKKKVPRTFWELRIVSWAQMP